MQATLAAPFLVIVINDEVGVSKMKKRASLSNLDRHPTLFTDPVSWSEDLRGEVDSCSVPGVSFQG